MCGISGVVINKNSNEVIRRLYNIFINQKARGLQGAGISINNGDKLFRFRSVSPFRIFNAYNMHIWNRLEDNSKVLFHHRYPTSSINEPHFNHPIANEDNTIHVIHNGILMNDDTLYKSLKDDHTFETKPKNSKQITDSEVIVHVFEDAYFPKRKLVKALKAVYETVTGSFALAFNVTGVDGIVLLRHSMPIIISKDDDGNQYFSSEYDKDLGLTKVHTMSEGECGILTRTGYKNIAMLEKKQRKKHAKEEWYMDDDFFPNYDRAMQPTKWGY